MKLRTTLLRTLTVMKLHPALARSLAVLATCAIAGATGSALAADAPATAGAAPAAPAAIVGNAKSGEQKISMCIGCHEIPGYKGSFPEVYHVPRIEGQDAKYIEAALKEYRQGTRSHPTMGAVAGSLSDQDIADLAAYYSTFK